MVPDTENSMPLPVQRTDWDMVAAFVQAKWQCKHPLKNPAKRCDGPNRTGHNESCRE